LKLIRVLIAAVVVSLALGAGAAQAQAEAAKPKPTGKAKANCKKKQGKAAKACRKAEAKKRRAVKFPRVTIRTTEYGIPRIVADDWRGLGYGYGFSLAKENICSMAEIYTTNRGERSKFWGPDGEWQLTGNGIEYTNLEADFAHKRVIATKTIEKLMKQKPPRGPRPQVKKVVDGYVKGYNAWLKKNIKRIQDPTCSGAPWVSRISKMDVYRRFFELGTMAGLGAAVDGIANASPPASVRSAAQAEARTESATAEDFERLNELNPDVGSNAVGLGSEATKTGRGMLFGNPHFPWSGSERFFQSQLTIPGKINVSGGSLLGTPVVLIGHTQKLAWSHTVSTARRFAFVQETLVPGDPTSYVVDGQARKMDAVNVTVDVKQPDGSIAPQTRTLYSTKHGPIAISVQKQPLFGWTNDVAFALRDPNSDGLRFINHFFDTNRAQNVKQLVTSLKNNQGVPWVNTIAADATGKALYSDIGAVPNLTDARVAQCNVPGIGSLAWTNSKVAVLDGSTSSCDLEQAPGAAAPGILPPSQMPLQVRSDYTSNMNDSYWLSNPKGPLEGFPSIIGDERSTRSLRTRNGLVQIEQKLAAGKFDLQDVASFITNNRNYSGELLAPPMVAYCQANPTINAVDVSEACAVLASWDKTENLDSPGALLWREVMFNMPGDRYATPFDVNDGVHTPAGLDTADPQVVGALADAVTYLESKGIPMNARYRDYQYVTKAGERIPIPGGLGGHGVFNVITAVENQTTGVYDSVRHGSSFIQAANMNGKKCPPVVTMLTYSQAATNELSKHYADMTRLFSEGGWVKDRFCAKQQKKSPGLKVLKLNGGAKAVNEGW
jgi:acyl-homoserine-lactone acylase